MRQRIVAFMHVALVAVADGAMARQEDRPLNTSLSDVRALMDNGRYEDAEARTRLLVDDLSATHGKDSLEVVNASDLLVRALLLNGKGASAATLSLAERTLRSKEGLLAASNPHLVQTLLNLGDALVDSAEYPRAISSIERALAIRREARGTESVEYAEVLDHLGSALTQAGRYDDALRALERSLRIKESASGPSAVGRARTLEAIGRARQGKGDYDASRAPVLEALSIRQGYGANHPAYASAVNLQGLQLWFEGNLVEASKTLRTAVMATERTLRPEHPLLARALADLAWAVSDLGGLAEARLLWQRAIAIAEQNYGPAHHEIGWYLNDLANAETLLGEYATARLRFERALKIAEARFGRSHDRVATAVYNLAYVDMHLGDYATAKREFSRAIAIWERVMGRSHPFVAVGLTGLAVMLRRQGKGHEALPLQERALSIRERSLGLNHRAIAATLVGMAATLEQIGDVKRAQRLAARAIDIWDKLDAPMAPDRAEVFTLYAEVQAASGAPETARDYYERALVIRNQVYGASHPTVAGTQVALAGVFAQLDRRREALQIATEAEKGGREHLGMLLRYLPERQALDYASNRPKGLDLMLSLIDATPDAPGSVLDALIRTRGLVFDEMAFRAHTANDARRPALAALWAVLATSRQRFANLIVRGPDEQKPDQYVALLNAARRESEAAERSLADESTTFKEGLEKQDRGIEDIRSALPPGSALVSIVRYDRTIPSQSATVPHYAAFVLTAGHLDPVVLQLGDARIIERAVDRWRHEAGVGVLGVTPAASDAAYRTAGDRLRRLTWDPLAPHLGEATRVFIVPDGALSLVNFSALPIGTSEYLVERAQTIHYLATERDLAAAPGESAATGLFALGGPAFDEAAAPVRRSSTSRRGAPGDCGTLQSIMFEQLPATLAEANEVATLWKSAAAVTPAIGGIHLSTAQQATERAFKQQAPGRRVLHLATHGFFLGGDCSPAAPGTRAVGRVTAARPVSAPAMATQNPLLVSGLAFAGANLRAKAQPDDEDGILTAEEIAGMNLQGTEWAVLSACDTGLGTVRAGEGVFGLRRAFQIAGVRTVIMSLWSVEDEATRRWMRALYRARLHERLDTAESVRTATLHVLHDRRARKLSTHPFHWGAFVSAGDWR